MKLTKRQLKKIIKEEYTKLSEVSRGNRRLSTDWFGSVDDLYASLPSTVDVEIVDEYMDSGDMAYVIELRGSEEDLRAWWAQEWGESPEDAIIEARRLSESGITFDVLKSNVQDSTVPWGLAEKLINLAVADDLEGALALPEAQKEHFYLNLEDVQRIFSDAEKYGDIDHPNWDINMASNFLDRLEREWYKRHYAKQKAEAQKGPNLPERTALGRAFTSNILHPNDLKYIRYQPRRRGGVVVRLDLEDLEYMLGHIQTHVDEKMARNNGTTIEKIMKVLEAGGAKLRKRRKRYKSTPPIYD